MADSKKLEADHILIKKLFGVDPLDWSRREDGSLSYLNQAGQKFIVSVSELDRLTNAWHDKAKVLQKAGLNPDKKLKPAGAAPAPQGLDGAPPAVGADAPAPASERSA